VAAVVAGEESVREGVAQDVAVDCILQHTATHCSTLQHTAAVAAEEGNGGNRGDVARAVRTHVAPAAATIASSVAVADAVVADVEDAACSHAHADTKIGADGDEVRGSVLQCGAVCCSVLQCVAVRCSELKCAAVCCVAMCRNVLQRIAICRSVA